MGDGDKEEVVEVVAMASKWWPSKQARESRQNHRKTMEKEEKKKKKKERPLPIFG